MARKIKNFTSDPNNCKYITFTIPDTIRQIGNETIILRATVNSRSKIENFSEFIRNLIQEENARLTERIKNSIHG